MNSINVIKNYDYSIPNDDKIKRILKKSNKKLSPFDENDNCCPKKLLKCCLNLIIYELICFESNTLFQYLLTKIIKLIPILQKL